MCAYVGYAEEIFYSDMDFVIEDEIHIHSKDKKIMYSKPKFHEATVNTLLPKLEMTRELYESLADKEKADWIGITPNNTDESIRMFTEKMKTLGITYRYSSDMLDEFMRLEEVVSRECRTDNGGYQWSKEKERKR